MYVFLGAVFLCAGIPVSVNAATGCVTVKAKVKCASDPDKVHSTEIELRDYDGPQNNPFRWMDTLDSDDLAAKAFPDHDGSVNIHGCMDDITWLPFSWSRNMPEPYLIVMHECATGGARREFTIPKRVPPGQLPKLWAPRNEINLGVIDLETEQVVQ